MKLKDKLNIVKWVGICGGIVGLVISLILSILYFTGKEMPTGKDMGFACLLICMFVASNLHDFYKMSKED